MVALIEDGPGSIVAFSDSRDVLMLSVATEILLILSITTF